MSTNIRAEAFTRYPLPTDVETGEPMDDWGYAECERSAFIAGAEWAAKQAPDPVDKVEALEAKVKKLEEGWDMLHFTCSNPDHGAAYLEMARVLGHPPTNPTI